MKLLSLLQTAEMADVMRSEGKIYVVVAGLLIVVTGFLAYLFFLDRKVTRLEKEVENHKK
ncbi:CcmD family protein [Leadbetterella sp. DM7]|uniref:CcmD family protein n=1 Tax=Leadbetterella sp. DM7 TaxID=3235085 RepID=UPI00349EFDB8